MAIILWAALLSGVAITTGLCVFLRPRFGALRPAGHASAMLLAAIVVAGLGASVVLPLLRRVEPKERQEDTGRWWVRMLPRALAVWAVGDAVGMFGAVVYLMTGRGTAFAATAVSLAIFAFTNPARLQAR